MNSNANAITFQEIFYDICLAFITSAAQETSRLGLSSLILSFQVDHSGSLSPFSEFGRQLVYLHE